MDTGPRITADSLTIRQLAERYWQGEADLVHEHPSMARNILNHAAAANARMRRDLAGPG